MRKQKQINLKQVNQLVLSENIIYNLHLHKQFQLPTSKSTQQILSQKVNVKRRSRLKPVRWAVSYIIMPNYRPITITIGNMEAQSFLYPADMILKIQVIAAFIEYVKTIRKVVTLLDIMSSRIEVEENKVASLVLALCCIQISIMLVNGAVGTSSWPQHLTSTCERHIQPQTSITMTTPTTRKKAIQYNNSVQLNIYISH